MAQPGVLPREAAVSRIRLPLVAHGDSGVIRPRRAASSAGPRPREQWVAGWGHAGDCRFRREAVPSTCAPPVVLGASDRRASEPLPPRRAWWRAGGVRIARPAG